MRWLWWMTVGLALLVFAQPVYAQTANQAGLIIVHGDGRVVSRCVDFSEPQISGYELLQRSGLDLNIEVNGVGVAICRLDGEGCSYPQQSCFCGTESNSSQYWSYWQWTNATWQYSNQGATNQPVQPGAVQGWVWGLDTTNPTTPPLSLTFAEVCIPPTATPTVTPSPTATPTTLATATLSPTPTALPPTITWTPWPTLAPTATPTPWLTATPLPVATATTPWTPTPAPPQITLFSGNPLTIAAGGSATLLWQVQNASQVLLRSAAGENPIGPVGNLVVQPTQNSTYVLVARNNSGEVTATVDLVVAAPAQPIDVQPAAALVAPTSVLPTPVVATPVLSTPTTIPSTPLPPTAAPTLPALAVAAILTNTVAPTTVLAALPNLQAMASPVLVVAPDPADARLQLLTLLGGVVLVLVVPLGFLGLVVLLWLVKQRS